MSRARSLLVTATAAAMALAGCSSDDSDSSSDGGSPDGGGGTRTVSTDQGTVEVPADPQTIVVLNANLAGYLYALDVPVHATVPERPGPGGGDYPEYWAEFAEEDGTVVLPWDQEGFDVEIIAAEEPDLIIGGGQGFAARQATDAYDQLAAVAPTVLVSPELLTWQEQLDFLAGEVLDAEAEAEELVAAYDARVAEVSAAITLPPVPVGYLVMTADGVPYSLPEDSALPRTLAELGFEPAPVVAENPDVEAYGTGDSFELSPELVGQVLTAPSLFTFTFNAEGYDVATLSQDPIFGGLPAFTGGHAYDLPYWAYRADYLRTMDLLDHVEEQFA